MSNDRLRFAIGRLERATGRVERILSESRPAGHATAAEAKLIRKHEELRQQVQSAISRIDSLITSATR
jgi:hypothetical protein